MKPDFFVSCSISKTFKIFCSYSQGHLTFMEKPIIGIAAKFQYNIPSLRTLAVMDMFSHGLEVVRLERVVLSYKDLEHFPPPPLEKLVLKTVQWNVIIIYCYHYCCCCCCR